MGSVNSTDRAIYVQTKPVNDNVTHADHRLGKVGRGRLEWETETERAPAARLSTLCRVCVFPLGLICSAKQEKG